MSNPYYAGIRIRVRRVRDGWIAFDSQRPVSNVSELIIDRDGTPGLEGYVIEGLYVDNTGGIVNLGPQYARRQTMVALGLHK